MEKSSKIVITGSNGFIGKNLNVRLKSLGFNNIYNFSRDSDINELKEELEDSKFIFHLAGVNRPKDDKEFIDINLGLTTKIIEFIENQTNKIPILFSSSIQANKTTPYGISKKHAEDEIFSYAKRNNVKHYVYRLTNVFGKWSKPNYNSVVATFCNNIANGISINITNRETQLELSYIDDVIDSFIASLHGEEFRDGKFCIVERTTKTTLGYLADKINEFNQSRHNLIIPSLVNSFDRQLYATFLSFLPDTKFSYYLNKKEDDRGWLAEFIKSQSFGQIFISKTKPGITRGNHWHQTKVEKFLVINGKATINFKNAITNETVKYDVDGEKPEVVDIPPGYIHSIKNSGHEKLITLFWACEMFDSEKPDTYNGDF